MIAYKNLPHITIRNYPILHEERSLDEFDSVLIAMYLKHAYVWRIRECLENTVWYTIEPLEGFYTLDENQGILSIGRDNYIITRL